MKKPLSQVNEEKTRQKSHTMSKPILLVIGGCNGSGKSSFSKLLVTADFEPFDYDYQYLHHYNSLVDSDFKDIMAHNLAYSTLEDGVNRAIMNKQNFCYETTSIQSHFFGLKFSKNTSSSSTSFTYASIPQKRPNEGSIYGQKMEGIRFRKQKLKKDILKDLKT